jgi:hypothetical protein
LQLSFGVHSLQLTGSGISQPATHLGAKLEPNHIVVRVPPELVVELLATLHLDGGHVVARL